MVRFYGSHEGHNDIYFVIEAYPPRRMNPIEAFVRTYKRGLGPVREGMFALKSDWRLSIGDVGCGQFQNPVPFV